MANAGIMRVISGASATIYNTKSDGTTPVTESGEVSVGAVKATIYADKLGLIVLSNPIISDAQGLIEFYAPIGNYHIGIVTVDGKTFGVPWYGHIGDVTNIASFVNAKAFGAIGDGIVDDTNAILAAIAATPDGGRLHLANGIYKLATWTLQTINKVISLTGDGIGNVIVKGPSSAISFLSLTKNFVCSGITFDTWNVILDFSAVSTIIDEVRIEHSEFKNYVKGIYGTNAVSNTGVRGFIARYNRFTNGSSSAIFLNLPIMEQMYICNNRIKDCVSRGIDLGGNSLVYADERGEYIIQNNIVDGVTEVGNTAIAIIAYGWRAIITGNIVMNVSIPADLQATNCNGIYTKCRYSIISNNILVDAGQAEGFINIKGGARDETVVQPYGFSIVCTNNILLDTQVNPVLGVGTPKRSNGIKIATSDVKCSGNYIEGMTELAIYTDSDVSDIPNPGDLTDSPCHNISITDNVVKAIRGSAAIIVFGSGRNIRVNNNSIDGVLNTYTPAVQNFGIKIAKNGGGAIDVSNNRVKNIADTTHTPVGIQIYPSKNPIDDVRVMDNHIDGADYGIQFHVTAPSTIDKVFVRHNTFGTIATTQILYSTLPTNLLEILAAVGVVTYEATNKAAVKSGTNAQELRIYGTRDGLVTPVDYERLSLQCNSTNVRIASQIGGTGTLNDIEIETNGASRWKFTGTDGHFQPMTSRLTDVGSGTLWLRSVYVSTNLFLNEATQDARIYLPYTNTAPGTTGAQTINKISGRVNAAAGTTSLVVTNNRVTAAAHVIVVVSTNDATARITAVVPAAGSFTIFYVAPTAETSMDFIVLNTN